MSYNDKFVKGSGLSYFWSKLKPMIESKASKTDIEQISNPNLLINGNFKNPVNQRGKTSYTGSANGVYTVDRWRINDAQLKVDVSTGYIKLTHDGGVTASLPFAQYMEREMEGPMTLSVKLKNNEKIYTHVTEDASTLSQTDYTEFTLVIDGLTKSVKFLLKKSKLAYIEWIKLEHGTIATDFVAKPHAEELTVCQRFFTCGSFAAGIRYEYGGQAGNDFTYNVRIDYPLMRVNPTFAQGDYVCSFISVTGHVIHPTIDKVIETTPTCALLSTSKNVQKAASLTCPLIGGMLDAEIYH